jgi:pilus assembly protein TadC
MGDSPFIVPVVLFICVAATIIGLPIARAYARRVDSGQRDDRALPDVTARLERMEQAIDSIAVEVERIAEGQRFTAKLLADRAKEDAQGNP